MPKPAAARGADAKNSSENMSSFLLLRHAASTWNLQKRWQGQQDPGLSPEGKDEAREMGKLLTRKGADGQDDFMFDAVVCSDLQRAQTTAEIMAEQMGIGDCSTDPLWRDRNMGEWEGLTKEDIDKKWPGWIEKGRFHESCEKAEELESRVYAALDELLRNYSGKRVLVVTHGNLITQLEISLGRDWERLPNLCGRWIKFDKKFFLRQRFWGR